MPSDVDPQILWQTTKCAIRGFCISFSCQSENSPVYTIKIKLNKIQSLQNLQKQHFTEQQATQLSSLKEEYDLLSHSKAEFILHRTRKNYYLESSSSQVQVELYCHSATCGDIQWNEMSCLTGPRCYINTNIQQ